MKREIAAGSIVKEIIVVTQAQSEYILEGHANAQVSYYFIMIDSTSITCTIRLLGSGAHVRLFGIYLLEADQECTIVTHQEHVCPQATSSVLIKGVLKGNARFQHR